ncbi:FAD-dependent oxidoreductase [Methylophilaceae bacterium]|nr:FAD-dependent oxidoreductase [Methylophilaceae bacterium]
MTPDFDVIIIGSGPAGVSAAFPLVESGLNVLMIDGGQEATIAPPIKPFLESREKDIDQWRWMVGESFYALQMRQAVSPKLRVPTNDYVFNKFLDANKIKAQDYVAVGSLATGGLSNAWGCGVAKLSDTELSEFPCHKSDLNISYETVARRIGISGGNEDDLKDYFGLDEWSQPPIELDALHEYLYARYTKRKAKCSQMGFRLGRSRVAALSKDFSGRLACNKSGNCMWGCYRKSLYSASDDLPALRKFKNFHEERGFIVDELTKNNEILSVQGQVNSTKESKNFIARKVMLAAGTLATTRLALKTIRYKESVQLMTCPTAAFLLWLPSLLGEPRVPAFGLGQLSFSLTLQKIKAFGSTFGASGISISEFVRHLPLQKRYGIDLLRSLLSSCIVGNVFLPGNLSISTAKLKGDGSLLVSGGYSEEVPDTMIEISRHLRKAYGLLGAKMLPGSFKVGSPGGDIHNSGTLPMRENPSLGETDSLGELKGFLGLHIVDGASLPMLTEKSHTLTIMANADRISRAIAKRLKLNT